MLSSIRSVLRPRDPRADYEAIGESASEGRPLNDREERKSFWAFWVLGAGVLLSWNVLICTMPLLQSYFPPGRIRSSLASILATVYTFGNLAFLGLAQRRVGKASPSDAMHKALLLLLVTSLVTTFPLLPLVLPFLSTHLPSALLPILLILTLALAVSTSYLQSSVFALASLAGSQNMLAVMSGQGGIAVLVSGVQVALAFISALSQGGTTPEKDGPQAIVSGLGLWALAAAASVGCLMAHKVIRVDAIPKEEPAPALKVFKKNWVLELAVAWVFIVTLAVFPPITTTITSTRHPVPQLLQPSVFIPLHFFIFNIGDYCGRTYFPALFLPTFQPLILSLSFGRTLFIPLFLLCNTAMASKPIINSDTLYFIIVGLFGASNGYVGSLCMINSSTPSMNPKIKEEEKDVAGTLAGFCLVAGLAIGSVASFGVKAIIS